MGRAARANIRRLERLADDLIACKFPKILGERLYDFLSFAQEQAEAGETAIILRINYPNQRGPGGSHVAYAIRSDVEGVDFTYLDIYTQHGRRTPKDVKGLPAFEVEHA